MFIIITAAGGCIFAVTSVLIYFFVCARLAHCTFPVSTNEFTNLYKHIIRNHYQRCLHFLGVFFYPPSESSTVLPISRKKESLPKAHLTLRYRMIEMSPIDRTIIATTMTLAKTIKLRYS